MSVQTEMLGGRLPLLDPQALSAPQKKTYDRLNRRGFRGLTAFPSRARLRTEDLSVHSTRFSSVPPFHRAF